MNPLTKLFLFMLVMVVMAGCSSNSGSFEANVFTKSDLTVIDGEHDAELFIGMDKKDVEKHLGQPISESEKMGNEYNGLRIFYRNDKVSQFVIQPDENNSYRFKTSRGLELGQRWMT